MDGSALVRPRTVLAATAGKEGEMGLILTGRLLQTKGKSGSLYDSAKRTQFFSTKNKHLTDRTTRCYAKKMRAKYLGSFWKTNPILRGIGGRFIEERVHFASALRRTGVFLRRNSFRVLPMKWVD
jgi:hypothetical protein